jgi:hypothetical protein
VVRVKWFGIDTTDENRHNGPAIRPGDNANVMADPWEFARLVGDDDPVRQ